MTAPQPAHDGEVCPSPVCDYPDHGWRPAAPSEPPAADSPTPGIEVASEHTTEDARLVRLGQLADRLGNLGLTDEQITAVLLITRPDLMRSGQGTTEPPAETQQDVRSLLSNALDRHSRRLAARGRPWLDADADSYADALAPLVSALAARPSADTETLREQVETWIDEAPEQTAGLDLLRQIIGRPR